MSTMTVRRGGIAFLVILGSGASAPEGCKKDTIEAAHDIPPGMQAEPLPRTEPAPAPLLSVAAEAEPEPIGPPKIPHDLEGRDECTMCHAVGGPMAAPEDHEGHRNETCRMCHKPGSLPRPDAELRRQRESAALQKQLEEMASRYDRLTKAQVDPEAELALLQRILEENKNLSEAERQALQIRIVRAAAAAVEAAARAQAAATDIESAGGTTKKRVCENVGTPLEECFMVWCPGDRRCP